MHSSVQSYLVLSLQFGTEFETPRQTDLDWLQHLENRFKMHLYYNIKALV